MACTRAFDEKPGTGGQASEEVEEGTSAKASGWRPSLLDSSPFPKLTPFQAFPSEAPALWREGGSVK